jgi:cell cycle checkpoint protein
MLYPASLRLWRKQEETADRLNFISDQLFATDGKLEISSRNTDDSVAHHGVESWRNNAFGLAQNIAGDENADKDIRVFADQKIDLLLDRLPYMSRILQSREPTPSSRSLLSTMNLITRPAGSDLEPLLETLPLDEADHELEGIVASSVPAANAHSKFSGSTRPGVARASGLGPTPTQHAARSDVAGVSISNLVLEDDDIVDD